MYTNNSGKCYNILEATEQKALWQSSRKCVRLSLSSFLQKNISFVYLSAFYYNVTLWL